MESSESNGLFDIVDGVQFDCGITSPHFITDTDKHECILEKPVVLIVGLKLLEGVAQSSKPLVIIADDVEGEVLGTLVVNKLRGALNVCAVKAPAFGDRKKEMMRDIATITGGTFIQPEIGQKLEDATIDMLGVAEKIVVSKDNTTIVNGAGSSDEIADRIQSIKTQIDESTSDYEKEKMQERLAKLSGGVAVLYIGAGSEVELKEKKDRVDDALQATKAAIEEGIVTGGGHALLSTIPKVKELEDSILDNDEKIGVNAGIHSMADPKQKNRGIDVVTGKEVDMIKAGIIDPVLVTKSALKNAVSVVTTIISADCVISNMSSK